MAQTDERSRRLAGIPGIGALNATALVAAVGKRGRFEKGRNLAPWLGLVPRQVTYGGKAKQTSAQDADRRGTIRHALVDKEQHGNRVVAIRASWQQSFQCRGRRTGEEDGIAAPRAKLQAHARNGGLRHIETRVWQRLRRVQ